MTKTLLTRAVSLLALTLSLTSGCDEGSQAVRPQSALPPRSVEDGLLYIEPRDDGNANTLLLDVASNDARVVRSELPAGIVQTLERPGANKGRQVIVFTSGRAAYKDGDGKHHELVPAHLMVFARTGELKPMTLPLAGMFGQIKLSEDGKYALAYQSSGFLVVQNAIQVVDLDKLAAKDPAPSQLVELLDGRETGTLVFSPPGTFKRRLVIAPLPNALQIIDLEHPERREISITLSEGSALTPAKIVFANDQFFVQNVGSPQILSFQFIPVARGEHDFQLAPTILNASSAVTDLAITGKDDKLRLLALSGRLDVLDPRIGTTAKVDAVTGFTQILQFDGKSPVDQNVTPRAALYAQGRGQIGFVDLGNESAWATRNVELIELGEALLSLQHIPSKNLALVRHASNKLSVVDLVARTVKRVLLDSTQATTLLDENAAHARLWVASGNDSLGSIDLVSFKATPVALSFNPPSATPLVAEADSIAPVEPSDNLVLVPRAGGTARRLAVLQRSDTGRVTFLDADNPVPATALEVLGFFLAGLFD